MTTCPVRRYEEALKRFLQKSQPETSNTNTPVVSLDRFRLETESTGETDQPTSQRTTQSLIESCRENGFRTKDYAVSYDEIDEMLRRADQGHDLDAMEMAVEIFDEQPEEDSLRTAADSIAKKAFALRYVGAQSTRHRKALLARALADGLILDSHPVTGSLETAMYCHWEASGAAPFLHATITSDEIDPPQSEAGWFHFFEALDLAKSGALRGFTERQAERITRRFCEKSAAAAYREALRLRDQMGGIQNEKLRPHIQAMSDEEKKECVKQRLFEDIKESTQMFERAWQISPDNKVYQAQYYVACALQESFESGRPRLSFANEQHVNRLLELTSNEQAPLRIAIALHFLTAARSELEDVFPGRLRREIVKDICLVLSPNDIEGTAAPLKDYLRDEQYAQKYNRNIDAFDEKPDNDAISDEYVTGCINGIQMRWGSYSEYLDKKSPEFVEFLTDVIKCRNLSNVNFIIKYQYSDHISFLHNAYARLLGDKNGAATSWPVVDYIASETKRVGPTNNRISYSGFLIPRTVDLNRSQDQFGRYGLYNTDGFCGDKEINLTAMAASRNTNRFTPSLIFAEDILVAIALAFGSQLGTPSVSLESASLYPDKEKDAQVSLRRKEFSPKWLANTMFGQSIYFADYLLGLDKSGGNAIYVGSPDDNEHDEYDLNSVGQRAWYYWKLPFPWNLAMRAGGTDYSPQGRLMIKLEHAENKEPRHEVKTQTRFFRSSRPEFILYPSDFPAFVEGAHITYEGNAENRGGEMGNMRAAAWRKALVLTENYDAMAKAYPVFERVRLLLNLYSSMCYARDHCEPELRVKLRNMASRLIRSYSRGIEAKADPISALIFDYRI